MASAGGGDCEGAAPEADRPHQRPFLIGVSGGTASGKVRGWAARRGLRRVRSTPGPWDSGRPDPASVRRGDAPLAAEVSAPGGGGGAGRGGAKGPRPGGGLACAGSRTPSGSRARAASPEPPHWPGPRGPRSTPPLPARRGPPAKSRPAVAVSLGQCLQTRGRSSSAQERPGARGGMSGFRWGSCCCVCSQSTVCEKIMELLGQNEVDHRQRKLVILSQDRFYKVLTAEQKAKALKGQYNFDHPGKCRP